ncbi:MAG: nucleotidyltransferase family protein [Clostridia bacterium]|nr:nucleotidyltransferase family protein [Clostridia bacterium]
MNNEEKLFLKSLIGPVTEDISGYDIKGVFKLASKHNILPLCFENISCAPDFETAAFPKTANKVFSIVFSQAKRSANFKKIYSALLAGGVKPLVLKGIICRSLYGDKCDHRPSGDEDILINKTDYFRIEAILKEQGYVPEKEVSEKILNGIQEITFKNPNGLNIEVHLNIIGTENKIRRIMNAYFDDVYNSYVSMTIDGQTYYTLGYTEHYIYLFYHMFKHFAMSGVGVRQILDMFKFGKEFSYQIDWNRVNNAIDAIGAKKLYGDILEIGRLYLGFNFENPFGVNFPDTLLGDIFSTGAYGNNNSEQIGSKVKVMAALDSEGKPSKLRMLFPSVESMREHYTVLYNHPYLLPFMWIVRIMRYVFRSKTGKTYDVTKSEAIADKKIQLLRDYEII